MKGIALPLIFILIPSINYAQVDLQTALGVSLNTPMADGSYTMTNLDGQGQDFTMTISSISGYTGTLVELDNATNLYQRDATVTISIDDPLYNFDVVLRNYQNLLTHETLTIDATPSNTNVLISQYNIYPAHCSNMAEVNGTPMSGALPAVNASGWAQTPTSANYTLPVIMSTSSPCYSYEISYEINNITEFSWSMVSTNTSKEGFIIYDLVVKPIPLPVLLDEYKIDCDFLQWSTLSEINSDYFEIEGSNDAKHWHNLHLKVPAQGNSSTITFYSFPSHNLTNYNYVRLSEVDQNGNKEYFKTLALFCDRKRKTVVSIYNIFGKKIANQPDRLNGVYILKYNDGSIEKRILPSP